MMMMMMMLMMMKMKKRIKMVYLRNINSKLHVHLRKKEYEE